MKHDVIEPGRQLHQHTHNSGRSNGGTRCTNSSLISIHTRLPKVKSISRFSFFPGVCPAVTVVCRSLMLPPLPSWMQELLLDVIASHRGPLQTHALPSEHVRGSLRLLEPGTTAPSSHVAGRSPPLESEMMPWRASLLGLHCSPIGPYRWSSRLSSAAGLSPSSYLLVTERLLPVPGTVLVIR
eukprot:746999-Hanusia_phi.AAC.6